MDMLKTGLFVMVVLLVGASALFASAIMTPEPVINRQEAQAIAQRTAVGAVAEVELDERQGKQVYEVEVVANNKEQEVIVDAQTGDVLDVDDEDSREGPDVPITGPAYSSASEAALAYIGEGRVTDTEVGDEEGYYEIEIRLDNGDEVDVHLDENFNVLSVEYD